MATPDTSARALALSRIKKSANKIPLASEFPDDGGIVLGSNGDPYWLNGGAPAYIRSRTLTPADFGSNMISGAAGDQSTGLIDFFAACLTDPHYHYCAVGQWNTAQPIVIDPGTFGSVVVGTVDFGMCNIYALTAISQLFTIQDCISAHFRGQLHLHGTNSGSDFNTQWTCDVGLTVNNFGNSTFEHGFCEGFGYAGTNILNVSDTAAFRFIQATRCGSGCTSVASRSRSANWSAATNIGSYGSNAQRTQVTVDALPCTFAQANTSGSPTNQLIVEINGRLHFVYNIDPVGMTLQFFPWLTSAEGTSGTLFYHYGGAVVDRGNDSNILNFGSIKGNGCGTAYEGSSLYGPTIGVLDSEANGSACRLCASPVSGLNSGDIGMGYCEGNKFNIVRVGLTENVIIRGRPAATPASKDVTLTTPLSTGDVFLSTALAGLTMGNPQEGWDFSQKVNQDVASANEVLDFNKAATFNTPLYRPPNGIQTLQLSAPDVNRRQQFRYDSALVAGAGVGNRMQPQQITLTLAINTHTITYNGVTGAAGASLTLKGFDSLALLWIYYDGNGGWFVGANNPVDGNLITYNGDVSITLTVGGSSKVQIFNTPLTANRTVTLSTSNATNGNRFRVVRSSAATGAFNLTVGGVNLTAAGQWIEFVFDGTAWVEVASGTLM